MNEEYGTINKKLSFLCAAKRVNLNDKTIVEDFVIQYSDIILVINTN